MAPTGSQLAMPKPRDGAKQEGPFRFQAAVYHDAVAIQCLSRNLLLPIHHLGDTINGLLKSSAAKSLERSDECWAVFQTGTGREEY